MTNADQNPNTDIIGDLFSREIRWVPYWIIIVTVCIRHGSTLSINPPSPFPAPRNELSIIVGDPIEESSFVDIGDYRLPTAEFQ